MLEPESIRDTVKRYVERLASGDVDGVMALYAAAPRVEDPVGREPAVGREAVRALYASAAGRLQVELTGPIRVAGREAAFPMRARVDLGERQVEMDVIDVMCFDEDGRVQSMRAFWSPADMRPVG